MEPMADPDIARGTTSPLPEAIPVDEAEQGYRIHVQALALALVVFHIYTGLTGPLANLIHRSVHIGLALLIVCLAIAGSTGWLGRITSARMVTRFAGAALIVASAGYVIVQYQTVVRDPRFGYDSVSVALGFVLIALLLVFTRRLVGWFITILIGLALLYPLVSASLAGPLQAPPIDPDTVVRSLYLTAHGILGPITGVSAREIAAFVIFGAVLMGTGAGAFFIDLAMVAGGRFRGGSAQVALIASTFFGMINGSAAANASSTGSVTIPMMKRHGYPPPFAAGVEAVASTGGQITPPVMGAVAFVMAELTNSSYPSIVVAAVVPAVAYLACAFIGIYSTARSLRLDPLPESEMPPLRQVFDYRNLAEFIIPVAVLVYLLFVVGRSATLSATSSIIALIVLSALMRIRTMAGALDWAAKLLRASIGGGISLARIAVIVATVQMLASVLTLSGLGGRLSNAIIDLGGANFFASLLLSMVVATVLGMAMPAVGAYVTGAAVVAPALVGMGVEVIPAHMFVLFFSILAAITPPICATLYITSMLAHARWQQAARYAVALGAAAWLVPYVVVYEPAILLGVEGSAPLETVTLFVGIGLIASSAAGWLFVDLRPMARAVLAVAGLGAVTPSIYTSIVACITGVVFAFVYATRVGMGAGDERAPSTDSVGARAKQ